MQKYPVKLGINFIQIVLTSILYQRDKNKSNLSRSDYHFMLDCQLFWPLVMSASAADDETHSQLTHPHNVRVYGNAIFSFRVDSIQIASN